MKPNYVTIKDIAKYLNVSVSTVSRAFNDKYDVKKETRDLILDTAKKFNYVPNPIAKKLIQRRTNTIGVVVPEFTRSFFPKVFSGIQHFFDKNNYQVVLMQASEHYNKELEILHTLHDNMVDGIIISLTKETTNIDYINKIIQEGMPVVLINRVNNDILAPKVLFDDYKWAFFATEHLIYNGYKNIIHFSTPLSLSLSHKRIAGFKDALSKHNLVFNEDQVIEANLVIETGELLTEKLISQNRNFDAIFGSCDRTAIGAIKALKKHHFRIPDDIGVIGFSESSLATVVEPNLTSVEQPTFQMGEKAAEILWEMITSEKYLKQEEFVLSGKINVRESTTKNHK